MNPKINLLYINNYKKKFNMNVKFKNLKLGIIGDELTGKTSILNAITNHNVNENEISTNNYSKIISKIKIMNKTIELIFFDITGKERYRENSINQLKNSLGLILVYSINNRKSFENCEKWLNEIKRNNIKTIPIILIGNKCDLEKEREVNKEEGLNYANKNGFEFFECSAKNKININESISCLIYSILGLTEEDYSSIPLNNIKNPILIPIIGDKNVGKSYIINNTKMSIKSIINDIKISINIKLLEYNILKYNDEVNKKNSGIILIYNINDRNSFENIKNWINNHNKINYIFYPLLLIGYNKDNNKRKISIKDVEEFVNKYFLDYYEILNIEELKSPFQSFIKNIILYNHNKIIKTNSIKIKKSFGTIITNLPEEIFINNNSNEYFGKCIYKNGKYEGYYKNDRRNKNGIMNYINKDKYMGNWLNDEKSGYGKMIYNNGDIYEGNWLNDEKSGYGKMIYNNGDIYEGNWLNDKRNGKGIINYINGEIYEGGFVNDKREGNGIMNFKNDDMYKGEFKNNEINGYGEMLYSNNIINGKKCKMYEGEWKNNKYNGKGKIYFDNHDIYEGNFKNGNMELNGKINYNNGDIYEGLINNFNKHGLGILKYKNGDIYIGNWINDKKEGEGMFEYNNGSIFEGYFKNNKRKKGIFFSNKEDYELIKKNNDFKEHFKKNKLKGIIYKCNFIDDKLNGYGLYIKPNEYYYEGNFLNNKRNGEGNIIYKNGDYYSGNWKDDKREGEGSIKFTNNNIYNGNWKNDKIEGKGIYQFNSGIFIEGIETFSNEDWEYQINQIEKKMNDKIENKEVVEVNTIPTNIIKTIYAACQQKLPINKSKIR